MIMVSGTKWTKSTFCSDTACLEAADLGGEIGVRNCRDRSGSLLRFSKRDWDAFLDGIVAGEFCFA